MSMNTEVIPGSPLYSQKYTVKKAEYKADLKLVSAMCLQGILSYPFRQNEPYPSTFDRVSSAIEHAKELLKQLDEQHE